MKLSEFKIRLHEVETFSIQLPDKTFVPAHFHITEMGIINKKYTDCGNTFREENYFTFQLWFANDIEHRLETNKVLKIVSGIEKNLTTQDLEIQVEYQDTNTIGKYKLGFNNGNFDLIPTKTTCLAMENCGIPLEKMKIKINELSTSCSPNSGCC
jgi:Family of unknown function (DUF6428)